MLDESAMEHARKQLAELRAAATAGGIPTLEVAEEDSPLPAFMLKAPSAYRGGPWDVACTLVPVSSCGERFVCVQLYACITDQIPEVCLEDVRSLIEGENARLLYGNLLLFCDRLSLKHLLTYPQGGALDGGGFCHAVHMLALQADAAADRCEALVEGCADVETLLREGTFGD